MCTVCVPFGNSAVAILHHSVATGMAQRAICARSPSFRTGQARGPRANQLVSSPLNPPCLAVTLPTWTISTAPGSTKRWDSGFLGPAANEEFFDATDGFGRRERSSEYMGTPRRTRETRPANRSCSIRHLAQILASVVLIENISSPAGPIQTQKRPFRRLTVNSDRTK
jgi:hypothetical protein